MLRVVVPLALVLLPLTGHAGTVREVTCMAHSLVGNCKGLHAPEPTRE